MNMATQDLATGMPWDAQRWWPLDNLSGPRAPSLLRLNEARWMVIGPTRPRPRVQPPPSSLMPTGPRHWRKGPSSCLYHGFFSMLSNARCERAGLRRPGDILRVKGSLPPKLAL